jgi:hypothetical protein
LPDISSTEKEDILLAGKSDLLEQQNPDLDNDGIDLLDIADGLTMQVNIASF